MITARQVLDAAMSEADFQRLVVEMAEVLGWSVWHDPDPLRCRSCGTMVLDNRRGGLPDLELLRGEQMLRWELKTMKGRVSLEQANYIERLGQVRVIEASIMRPCDMPDIEARLRGARQ